MRKNFGHIFTVSFSTLGSRLFGLLRDILIYAQLGLSQSNSAFILAFTLPNLFRRLLGEGALSTALIPVFTGELTHNGAPCAYRLLNRTLTRAVLALIGLGLLFSLVVGVPYGMGWLDGGRYAEAARLSLILFPYVLPICLAALFAAALQVLRHFFTPAITPVLLNLSMIAFLAGPGIWLATTPQGKVLWLCAGVLLGGLLQLVLPAYALYRRGWRPRIDWSGDPALERLWSLFLPAVAGAAILQVNILVSRSLAFLLDDAAVSILYLASRLIELPLGMFAIAVVTVLYPLLARHASENDNKGFRNSFRDGSGLVLAVTLPAAIGLGLLGGPILQTLFGWGVFNAADAAVTAPVLAIYAVGLPFYAQATLLSRALQAREDMKTPVKVAGRMLILNLVLSLILMVPYGIHGLAAANSLAAVAQTLLLQWKLRDDVTGVDPARATSPDKNDSGGPVREPTLRLLLPTDLWKVMVASLATLLFLLWVPVPGEGASKASLALALLWILPAAVILQFSLLILLRFRPFFHDSPLARAKRIPTEGNPPETENASGADASQENRDPPNTDEDSKPPGDARS